MERMELYTELHDRANYYIYSAVRAGKNVRNVLHRQLTHYLSEYCRAKR